LAALISSMGESLPKTAAFTRPQVGLRQNYAQSYYRARYYDPTVGRFLSEDPLAFHGGDVDFYSYVFNGPVDLMDPFGTDGIVDRILNRFYPVPPPPSIPIGPPPLPPPAGISYNNTPPTTVPVTGRTNDALQCLAHCLQCVTNSPSVHLRVTGGAEQSGHTKNSFHYSGQAVDISFFNPFNTTEVFACGKQCGFSAGQPEPALHHWHLQLTPGNGVRPLPPTPLPMNPSCGCHQ
jgi:RHS repeat-associated protein